MKFASCGEFPPLIDDGKENTEDGVGTEELGVDVCADLEGMTTPELSPSNSPALSCSISSSSFRLMNLPVSGCLRAPFFARFPLILLCRSERAGSSRSVVTKWRCLDPTTRAERLLEL